MNLLEFQGKELFEKYGIAVPKSKKVTSRTQKNPFKPPFILKSQVPVGDRKHRGGIATVKSAREYHAIQKKLFRTAIDGHVPEKLLAEELVPFTRELYVSFSFDTHARSPLLALSASGGTGISRAFTLPVDLSFPSSEFLIRDALRGAGLPLDRGLIKIIQSLWELFISEKALLAEINPLFLLKNGEYVAGDAKIVLDDHVVAPEERSYVELGGNIAVLASGGGASMVNLDALMRAGGRPANYVEYSGNPKSEIVQVLTRRVLKKPGLQGLWVVGGTANFTDIYETLKGFLEGLRKVKPRPAYPIVIRRDGPRREEAFRMLEKARAEGFDFYVFGPETSMAESAKILVKLSYGHTR